MRLKFFLFLSLLVVFMSCTTAPVVSTAMTANKVERDYSVLSQAEVVEIAQDYDTATPELSVTKNGDGQYTITAGLGDRTWSRNIVDYNQSKKSSHNLIFFLLGAVIVIPVLLFKDKLIAWIVKTFKSAINATRT